MSNINVEVNELADRGWSPERIAAAMAIPLSWVASIYAERPVAEEDGYDHALADRHASEQAIIARLTWR